MVRTFPGKDIAINPTCPFCDSSFERPVEECDERVPEMPTGNCSCGAAFACDVTGHNLGTAMIEALVCACRGDWDMAWNLMPGKDYEEKIVKNYDLVKHMIVPGGAYGGRSVGGALYFIRLSQSAGGYLQESEQGVQKRLGTSACEHPGSGEARGKKFTRKEVETLVNDSNFDVLLEAALEDKHILRHIKRLLYSADPLTRLRAADALGRVCSIIAPVDPGPISKLLQGLLTSVSDTAASSWGAIDAIGEILGHTCEQFENYVPQLYLFLRDRELIIETLRALGRIGESRPQILRKEGIHFISLLYDRNPAVRGYAAIVLGNLGTSEAKGHLEKLRDDREGIELYHNGNMEIRTVGSLASEALEKLA